MTADEEHDVDIGIPRSLGAFGHSSDQHMERSQYGDSVDRAMLQRSIPQEDLHDGFVVPA